MGEITRNFNEKYYGFLFHYYRAEVYRETSWRNRLDVTTNWAIVVTAAMLSFVFGTGGLTHVVLLFNFLIVWFFLLIEARRFRYYSVVRERVKILEKRMLGPLFKSEEKNKVSDDWLSEIGDKLITPKIKITRLESVAIRLKRNYIFMFIIIYLVWFYKVVSYPNEALTFYDFLKNAGIWFIPGIIPTIFMTTTLLVAFIVAIYVPKKHVIEDLP